MNTPNVQRISLPLKRIRKRFDIQNERAVNTQGHHDRLSRRRRRL